MERQAAMGDMEVPIANAAGGETVGASSKRKSFPHEKVNETSVPVGNVVSAESAARTKELQDQERHQELEGMIAALVEEKFQAKIQSQAGELDELRARVSKLDQNESSSTKAIVSSISKSSVDFNLDSDNEQVEDTGAEEDTATGMFSPSTSQDPGSIERPHATTRTPSQSTFLSLRSNITSMSSNDGIHSNFAYLATSSGAPVWKKIAGIIGSWALLCWQIWLYYFLVFEVDSNIRPACKTDEDCTTEEWTGWCMDEGICEIRQFGSPCNTEEDCYSGYHCFLNVCGPPCESILDCNQGYCLEDVGVCWIYHGDLDCQFLDKYIPWSTGLSVLFVLVFIMGSLIDDMDQASRIYQAGMYRLNLECRASNSTCSFCVSLPSQRHHCLVGFHLWAQYYVRVYLIPYLTCIATVAIIYADSTPTTSSVILNGLAVIFIGTFDDALVGLLIPSSLELECTAKMDRANYDYIKENNKENNYWGNQFFRMWIFHRVMCITYAVLVAWIVFDPNRATRNSPGSNPDVSSCSDFILRALFSGWLLVAAGVFSLLDKIVIGAPVGVIVRDFFLSSIFLGIIWYAFEQTSLHLGE